MLGLDFVYRSSRLGEERAWSRGTRRREELTLHLWRASAECQLARANEVDLPAVSDNA